MVRIIGALIRALVMVIIISAPSFLLPNVTDLTKELLMIVGAIIGAFTFFEYGGSNPGFVDFRFAPPFNRFRVAILATQVVAISLICRASVTGYSEILALADQAVALTTFPNSPVELAVKNLAVGAAANMKDLIAQVLASSFVIAVGLSVAFSALLWIFRWPAGRADFNIWRNLPTFTPAEIGKTEKKLKRDGVINILLSVGLLFGIPYTFPYIIEALGSEAMTDYQTLVWLATLWAFLPALLFVRGASIIKIGRILDQAVKRT